MIRRLPAWLRYGYTLLAAALIGLSWFAYVPPFRWAAEAQIALLGAYSPVVAFGICLVGAALPFFLLAAVFPKRGEDTIEEDAELARRYRWPWSLVAGGVTLAAMGAWNLVDAMRIGDEQIAVTLASLEDGQPPPSRWVTLSGGRADFERAIALRDGGTTSYFVPLVRRDAREDPLVIVEATQSQRDSLRAVPLVVEGVLRNSIVGDVRVQLERSGIAAGSYWVLDLGDSPEERREIGTALAPAGGVLLVLGIVWWVVRARSA